MPNIGAVLKGDLAARPQGVTWPGGPGMRKASAQYRRHIAALKRQVAKLESQVTLLRGKVLDHTPAAPVDGGAKRVRFVPKALRSQRLGHEPHPGAPSTGAPARGVIEHLAHGNVTQAQRRPQRFSAQRRR